ncbi:unnamed protein product [Adineta steineri]|uniref:Uncharacterized protein n=1 Tax=Adineta steineri TaxID=433720 RepID=A0A818JV65_9BILA|nr:unnamed protein product [Adineta steineri]CAF3541730.1 unnamed protein product [Adineta steineri]
MLKHSSQLHWKVYVWFYSAAERFELLSSLCQLADKTIDDAVQRLNATSFITPNLINESDFNSQLDTTLSQFNASVIIQFGLLVDTKHLFIRVDQPYTKPSNTKIIHNVTVHNNGSREPAQVCANSIGDILLSLFAIDFTE